MFKPHTLKNLCADHFSLAAASILKPSRPLRMFKIANIANSKTILCEGNLYFWKLSWSSVIPTVLRFFAYGSRTSKNLSHFKGQDLNMLQSPLTAGASATLATTTILISYLLLLILQAIATSSFLRRTPIEKNLNICQSYIRLRN